MDALEPGVVKKEPTRRGTTLPPALRDMEKLVEAFAEEFSFARNEVTKLKTKLAHLIEAWRREEARHSDEHHQVRSRLNTLCRVERWINASDDEEMKAFFRRVWRD